jgi:hypothetical protein
MESKNDGKRGALDVSGDALELEEDGKAECFGLR